MLTCYACFAEAYKEQLNTLAILLRTLNEYVSSLPQLTTADVSDLSETILETLQSLPLQHNSCVDEESTASNLRDYVSAPQHLVTALATFAASAAAEIDREILELNSEEDIRALKLDLDQQIAGSEGPQTSLLQSTESLLEQRQRKELERLMKTQDVLGRVDDLLQLRAENAVSQDGKDEDSKLRESIASTLAANKVYAEECMRLQDEIEKTTATYRALQEKVDRIKAFSEICEDLDQARVDLVRCFMTAVIKVEEQSKQCNKFADVNVVDLGNEVIVMVDKLKDSVNQEIAEWRVAPLHALPPEQFSTDTETIDMESIENSQPFVVGRRRRMADGDPSAMPVLMRAEMAEKADRDATRTYAMGFQKLTDASTKPAVSPCEFLPELVRLKQQERLTKRLSVRVRAI